MEVEVERNGSEQELRVTGQGLLPLSRNDDEGPLLRLHSCIDLLQKPKYPGEDGLKGLDPWKNKR